jgi:hypothetical protein
MLNNDRWCKVLYDSILFFFFSWSPVPPVAQAILGFLFWEKIPGMPQGWCTHYTVCFSSGFFSHVELFESWICLGFAGQKTDPREETKKQRETDCKWHLEQLTDVCKIASAYRLRCSTWWWCPHKVKNHKTENWTPAHSLCLERMPRMWQNHQPPWEEHFTDTTTHRNIAIRSNQNHCSGLRCSDCRQSSPVSLLHR